MTNPIGAEVGELRGAILSMADRLKNSSDLPQEGIADLKGAVDDLRIRLWGILMSEDSSEYHDFVGRFRMRRAAECCRGIDQDVAAGMLSANSVEGAQLQHAARHLANRLDGRIPGAGAAHPSRPTA